jgi:hypothetical protein
MAILIKNNGSIFECTIDNIANNTRISEPGTDIGAIRATIMDYDSTVNSSTNTKIRNLKKATSFPIEDIFQVLANNPDCKYLRVYNGFTPDGNYISYLAPIDANFASYVEEDSSDNTIISAACCQCNPCSLDKLLNQPV